VTNAVAQVAIIMGSDSDWPTMQETARLLADFGVSYEAQVVSAHRTPDFMAEFAQQAASNGFQLIIAGAGGAAHLPGMVAAFTTLPVIGVPIKSAILAGVDSLLSIVQMPAGVPVATMAIGVAGAKNAALFAIRQLAVADKNLTQQLQAFQQSAKEKAMQSQLHIQPL